MDKKSFGNYKVEDFVADESFINYHFRLNENDRIFWEDWIKKNPSKKSIAKEADQIIDSFSLTLNEREYQKEFEKLQLAIEQQKPRSSFRLLSWSKSSNTNYSKRTISFIMLGILIIAAGATYFLFATHSNKKVSQLMEMVNSSGKVITFILSDSTVVTLAPNSTLKYPSSFQGENRQVYLNGEAGFHVKRNEHFPFKVHNGNIVTTVLGTIFNIKKQGDSAMVVELLKGKLKVEIEDTTAASPILLNSAEKAIYVFHDKHFYKNSAVTEASVSFHQSSFEEIAVRIKSVFGITVINNSNKKNWRFTGEFKNISANDIIENICIIKNLKSKIVGDTIFINN